MKVHELPRPTYEMCIIEYFVAVMDLYTQSI